MTWKEEFDEEVRKREMSKRSDHYDFKSLYIKLEQLGKKYIQTEQMFPDEFYDIPLEDGTCLRIQFSETFPALSAVNAAGKEMLLVSKEDSAIKEYSALDHYSFGKEACGIGHKYPDRFREAIVSEMQPGRMMMFDNISPDSQVAILCTKRYTSSINYMLLKLGDYKEISAKAFNIALDIHEQELSIENGELQKLYNCVKSQAGNVIPRVVDIDCFAQEKINGVTGNLAKGKTAILQFGNERFRVQRNLLNGRLTWYDKRGTRISENAVKTFISWCHNAPTVLEVRKRSGRSISDDIKISAFHKAYEGQLLEHRYDLAALTASEFCKNTGSDFAVNISSYNNENPDNPVMQTYCFKAVGGNCRVYRIEYPENDMQKPAERIVETNIDDFINFCRHKYDDAIKALAISEYNKNGFVQLLVGF